MGARKFAYFLPKRLNFVTVSNLDINKNPSKNGALREESTEES